MPSMYSRGFGASLATVLAASVITMACSSSSNSQKPQPDAGDGGPSAGGSPSTGGRSSSGGSRNTGGTPSSGGSVSSGGSGNGGNGAAVGGTGGSNARDSGADANVADATTDAADAAPVMCPTGFGNCDQSSPDCETAVNTDMNCGACGRSCTAIGTTCSTTLSLCGNQALAAKGASGLAGVTDATNLYVMNVRALPPNDPTITRFPLNGNAPVVMFSSSNQTYSPGISSLVTDGTKVYFGTSISGTLAVQSLPVSAPANSTPTTLFTPVELPYRLVLHASTLYWTSNATTGHVFSRPLAATGSNAGTEIVTVAQVAPPSALAVSDNAVYWVVRVSSTVHLYTVPLAGGTPADVPGATAVTDNAQLTTLGNTLYFVNGNTGIYKYTPGDAKATLVTGNTSVHALIADAQWLYFQGDYGDATLWKVPLTGGSPKAFALQAAMGGFAGQDAKYLYTYYSWGSDGPSYKVLK